MKLREATLIKTALAAHIDEMEKLAMEGPEGGHPAKGKKGWPSRSEKPRRRIKEELGIGTLKRYLAGKARRGE